MTRPSIARILRDAEFDASDANKLALLYDKGQREIVIPARGDSPERTVVIADEIRQLCRDGKAQFDDVLARLAIEVGR